MGYDGTLKFDTGIDTKGFQDGIDTIGKVAKTALNATVGIITTAATAISGMGAAAVKVGIDFETSMSNVAAISGATGEELEQLTEKAKEMGATSKFSAAESADAFGYMAMAGWKTYDMLSGIEGIMNLAAASGEDLATTCDIVTDALTAFGLSASDSGHFSDVLAAASSNANTNVSLMGETFKYVGTMAGTLGYSIEDTALAIGLMANAGLKGSMAGTSLNSMLTRLATNTGGARDAIKALGISFFDENGNARALGDVLSELRVATADMSDEQKTALANTIAGMEGQKGLNAILNASQKDYDQLANAIAGATDEAAGYSAAAEMAAIMNDNLQGQLTYLKSALEGLGISIYENVEEPMKGIVTAAQDMVAQLNDAFSEGGFQGLVSEAGGLFAEIATEAAKQIPTLVDTAISLCSSFVDSILENKGEVVDAGVKLIVSLGEGLLSFGGQLWSAAIELGSEIIQGLLSKAPEIAGVGIDLISQLFDSITTECPRLFELGLELLNNISNGIRENLPQLIPVALESLMNFSGTLRRNAGLLVDAGLNLSKSLAESLISNIPALVETVPTIVTNIAGIINDNAPKLIATGLELIAKLVAGLIQAIPTIVANIPQIVSAIYNTIMAFNWISLGSNIITFIKNGITNLAEALPGALKSIGDNARNALHNIDWAHLGTEIINFIGNGILALVQLIPNTLQSIGHSAVALFKSIDWIDVGINIINGIVAGLSGALDGLLSAAGDLCSGLLDTVTSFFGIHSPSTVMAEQGEYLVAGMAEGLAGLPEEAMQAFAAFDAQQQAWSKSLTENVRETFAQMPESIAPLLTNMITTVIQFGSNLVSQASTIAGNTISRFISAFVTLSNRVMQPLNGVVSSIIGWGSSLVSTMSSIGVNAMQGLINGIGSMVSRLYDSIRNALSGLVDKAKDALGIHSPSKVMKQDVGRWIPEGIEEGIKEQMPDLEREAQLQMTALSKKMKAAVEIETQTITVKQKEEARHRADIESGKPGVVSKEEFTQINNYHVPVASPSTVSKNNRESARKLVGGVK